MELPGCHCEGDKEVYKGEEMKWIKRLEELEYSIRALEGKAGSHRHCKHCGDPIPFGVISTEGNTYRKRICKDCCIKFATEKTK